MCTGSRIIKNVETDDKTTNLQLNTDINSNKTKTYRCDETKRCITLGFDHKKKISIMSLHQIYSPHCIYPPRRRGQVWVKLQFLNMS